MSESRIVGSVFALVGVIEERDGKVYVRNVLEQSTPMANHEVSRIQTMLREGPWPANKNDQQGFLVNVAESVSRDSLHSVHVLLSEED